jgi:hypothetical protein
VLNDGLKLANELGLLVEHEQWVHASVLLSRQIGDLEHEVRALQFLGYMAMDQHRPIAEAVQHVEAALRCAQELDNPGWIGACLSILGTFAHARGELIAAEAYMTEALAWHRRNGGPTGIARQLINLAQFAMEQGDFRRATALAGECLTVLRATKEPSMTAELLIIFATSLAETGDALLGARLLGAAVEASETVGECLSDEDSGRIVTATHRLRTALGEERWAAAFAEGRGLSLEAALAALLDE